MNAKDLSRILSQVLILGTFCGGLPSAYAQQTSEQFIPIGMSPGVSNSMSYIGSITGKNNSTRTITMLTDGETKTIKVTATTRIWLDRSKIRKSNIEAVFEQLSPGSRIEVLPDRADREAAAWVKVESL